MNNNSLQVTQMFTFTIAFLLHKVSFFHLQKCLLSHFKDNIHNVSDFDSHVGSATGTDHRLVYLMHVYMHRIMSLHLENNLK